MANDRERALLVVIPLEDLQAARTLAATRRSIVLPAGGPGDLDLVPVGTPVLLMASDPAGEDVPAATWRAELVGRLAHEAGQPYPDALPPTWLDRHSPSPADTDAPVEDLIGGDDEPDDEDLAGPQAFFEVTSLRELPTREWLFVNELIGKQARGGRTFFPRVPMMVQMPD